MPSDANVIAERYVRAFFDLASEAKTHDAVKRDLLTIQTMIGESGELRSFLINPLITRKQAGQTINELLVRIKASDLTRKFFATLAAQRRLALTDSVIEKYLGLLATAKGELAVQVISAASLSKEQLRTLSEVLTKATGKKIELKTSENPALIGGVQVQIGSTLFDNSIAGKLARLTSALTKAA
jgi:F-type H+-transporting ATPase subunit delta